MGVKSVVLLFLVLVALTLALPQNKNTEPLNHVDYNLRIQSDLSSRIVGGEVPESNSHPHMVALTSGVIIKSFVCGGSLVTDRSVLTAAHCIGMVVNGRGNLVGSVRGTMGTNRWRSGTTFSFLRNVTHPHYVSSIIKNDIGLLITNERVVLTNTVNTIPMSFGFIGADVPVQVAGWGRTSTGGSISATLRELTMTTISGDLCVLEAPIAASDVNMVAPPVEPELEICAFHSRGNGMCNGDTGSPLILRDSRRQVGIVSWGIPCAVGGPDVFVRLSAYQTWLFMHLIGSTSQ